MLYLPNGLRAPACVFWFTGPRSYTGQDVVELHAPGCLPLLREICNFLIVQGARRALPGEFTARAFLAGRMAASDVEHVLALLRAGRVADVQDARRSARARQSVLLAEIREKLEALLAGVEAGIDFVEEEDVRFVSAPDALLDIGAALANLRSVQLARDELTRPSRPHVALVGLPNAGKSTLFNALAGCERAIVSPVIGTTRDILSAQVMIHDRFVILQDCAGLGDSEGELERAAHLAAETAADQADLVLWIHASDLPWTEREAHVVARIPRDRRLLVLSKSDLRDQPALPPAAFGAAIAVAAPSGSGLEDLRRGIAERLEALGHAPPAGLARDELHETEAALLRVRELLEGAGGIAPGELVAAELRAAIGGICETAHGDSVENVLARIFSQFCVGK
jgi:tRNA modification GTPase